LGRSCGDHGSCALLTLDGTKTPYHKLKVVLKILPFSQPRGVFRFILSGASDHEVYRDPLDKDGVELRQMLGIRNYPCDSSSTVFLAITSGDVEVRKSVWKGKGPSPSHVSTEKGSFASPPTSSSRPDDRYRAVQTAYRNVSIHGKENAIRMLERAGLNNSTGQRLWDCALGLSFYLSNHPKFLFPPSSVSSAAAVGSPGDEPQTVLQVVELGAGCGLSGLVARWMLSDFASEVDSKVVFTDIQATVDTTLSENLALNSMGPEGPVNVAIPQVLNWGPLSPSDLDRVFSSRKGPFDLTILGSDILYNPESHSILLESLLALMKPRKGSTSQAIIAYKKRTEGDDAFFQLASDAGLEVKMVCDGLMGIEVWRFLCK
jgi:hypothetical protein